MSGGESNDSVAGRKQVLKDHVLEMVRSEIRLGISNARKQVLESKCSKSCVRKPMFESSSWIFKCPKSTARKQVLETTV